MKVAPNSWHSGSQKPEDEHWYDDGGWVYAAFAVALILAAIVAALI